MSRRGAVLNRRCTTPRLRESESGTHRMTLMEQRVPLQCHVRREEAPNVRGCGSKLCVLALAVRVEAPMHRGRDTNKLGLSGTEERTYRAAT